MYLIMGTDRQSESDEDTGFEGEWKIEDGGRGRQWVVGVCY